jgi:hypothetical protein
MRIAENSIRLLLGFSHFGDRAMIRKLLDRLDPTRQLPEPMRRYLELPNRLLLAWLLVSALLLAGPAVLVRAGMIDAETRLAHENPAESAAPETLAESDTDAAAESEPWTPPAETPMALALAGDLDAQLPERAEITVAGATAFTLRRSGDKVLLSGSGLPVLQLAGDAEALRVETSDGKPVYRLKIKEADQGKIYDAAGRFLFRLKCETEDGEDACKLYDPAGNKLNRVKLKGDSFNVYGPGSGRLYKGKLKNGAYQVRDEADKTVLTLRGAGSLKEAALLSMPVEPAVRMLLWRHAGR